MQAYDTTRRGGLPMKTRLTAHAGCDGRMDNSTEFLRHAMALPVDLVEVDVRRGAGGALVLAHDEGPAAAMLADALSILVEHPEKKLNCDLKQRGLEASVRALAGEYGVGGQIAFSGEVSTLAARETPGIFEEIEWYVNLENLFPEANDRSFAATLTTLHAQNMASRIKSFLSEHHARCLNVHYRVEETKLYPELMRRGIPLSVWTPDDERTIERFLRGDVYNITTRNAAAACQLRSSILCASGAR